MPLESLASYVQRLRWANYCSTDLAWLRALVPGLPEDLNTLRHPEHYEALCALTGLDVPALVGLTLHRFAPRYQEPYPHAPPAPGDPDPAPCSAVQRWARRNEGDVSGRAAVCPQCWQEQHALRLPWSLSLHTTCHRHRTLLLDRCPRCGLGLGLHARTEACPHCAQGLAAMPAVSIAAHPTSMALSEAVWSATGCTEEQFPPTSLGLAADHPLRRISTPALLRALRTWAERLLLCTEQCPLLAPATLLPGAPHLKLREWWYGEPYLGGVDLATRHHVLTATWRLLHEWAAVWYQVLPPTDRVTAACAGAGVPYPIVLGSENQGLRWTLANTSWLTTVWQQTDHGYPWGRDDLPAYPAARSTDWSRDWDTQDLLLPVHAAASYAQLSEEAFVTLVANDVLPGVYQTVYDHPTTWRFTERMLYQGLQALLGRLPVRPFRDLGWPAADLSWVASGAERLGVDLATVLGAVRDGTLTAVRTRPTVQLVDLWFEQDAVMAFLEERQWPAYRKRTTARDWSWRWATS